MANKFVFNPFTANFDIIDDEVHQVAGASNTANQDLEVIADGSANGIIYFWVNGHRFKLTGTVDDPALSSGIPMGLLLALTYP